MDKREQYGAAVTYAKSIVSGWLADASPEDTPEKVLLRLTLGVGHAVWVDGSHLLDAPDASLENLAHLALTRQGPRDLLKEIVSTKLLCGKPLTDVERRFAGEELAGRLPPVSKKVGKKAGKYFWRDAVALLLARDLVEKFGLKTTRNDAVTGKFSACDAIEEAFIDAGVKGTSYNALKRACTDKKLVEQVNLVLGAIREQKGKPTFFRAGLIG